MFINCQQYVVSLLFLSVLSSTLMLPLSHKRPTGVKRRGSAQSPIFTKELADVANLDTDKGRCAVHWDLIHPL